MNEWTPSERLRRWLLAGALAVGVDVCLCAASLAVELSRPAAPEGLSVTDVLDGSVVIPEIVVLCAFLALAHELGSLSLWRSSIGLFGSLWLLMPLMFTSDEGWHWWDTVLSLAVVAGGVGVFILVIRRPAAFGEPEPPNASATDAGASGSQSETSATQPEANAEEEEEEEEEEEGGSTGWGCGSAVAVALVVKMLLRGLRRVNVDWLWIATLALGGLLLCCLAVFSVWFGVAKIRLRDRLGPIAAVCGAVDILSVVVYLAAMGYGTALVFELAENGQEPDFHEPRFLGLLAGMALFDIVWKLLIAALFLSARGRGQSPWHRDMDESDRYINR